MAVQGMTEYPILPLRQRDCQQKALQRFRFNPHAADFAPSFSQKTLLLPGGRSGTESATSMPFDDVGLATFMDLPREALELVLSKLSCPKEMLRVACCCRLLCELVRGSPLAVSMHTLLPGVTATGNAPPGALEQLFSFMRGITQLDASASLLHDHEVGLALDSLPKLQSLVLDRCRKLTPGVCSLLFARTARTGHAIQHVSMQRCFQLTSGSVKVALTFAQTGASQLSTLCLSHLSLDGLPGPGSGHAVAVAAQEDTVIGTAGGPAEASLLHAESAPCPEERAAALNAAALSKSTLKVLALNTCSEFSAAAADYIAASAPGLEALLLGGCQYRADGREARDEARWSVVREHVRRAQQLCSEDYAATLSPRNSGKRVWLSPSQGDRTSCSALSLLASSPAFALSSTSSSSACADAQTPAAPMSLSKRRVPDAAPVRKAHDNFRAAALLDGRFFDVTCVLVYTVTLFPSLRALELTHMRPGIVELVRRALQSNGLHADLVAAIGDRRRVADVARVHVYDLLRELDVVSFHTFLDSAGFPGATHARASAGRAAAGCTSAARFAPLHAAAMEGNVVTISELIALGAPVDTRGKSGASPLFHACEAGHEAAARMLLDAGSDVWRANFSGETCLYIAALRGHAKVVELLLEHVRQQKTSWMDVQLYGDGWTPLMSAVVAGHINIAASLLVAAGADSHHLLSIKNKHGQNALHIAAYRGCAALLKLLLRYDRAVCAREKDANGQSPAQIAKRNSHWAAVDLLSKNRHSQLVYSS